MYCGLSRLYIIFLLMSEYQNTNFDLLANPWWHDPSANVLRIFPMLLAHTPRLVVWFIYVYINIP
jgi:hypothetical protein